MWGNDGGMRDWVLVAAILAGFLGATDVRANQILREDDGYYWDIGGSPRPLPLERGREAFERANDPAHAVFTGLGVGRDQTLAVDQSSLGQAFAILGRGAPLPGRPLAPVLGYASSNPGDSTVLLIQVDDCPTICNRISRMELRRNARGLPAQDLLPSPAVHAGIATQSGLRLGLTRDEVKAVLGWPHHEEKNSLRYGAEYVRVLTEREVLERGFDREYVQAWVIVFRAVSVTFSGGRVDSVCVREHLSRE